MIKTILLTIGFLALLEGIIVILFPKSIGKTLRKISSKNKVFKAGLMEIIASIIIISIGFIVN